MSRDRRGVVAAAAVLALVGLALWQWSRADPTSPAHDAEVRAPHPAAPGAAATATQAPAALAAAGTPATSVPAGTPGASPAPGTVGADAPLAEQAQVVAIGRQAADEYRRLAQYPPWSRPFGEEGEDPILRDRMVSPITAAGPNGEDPTLVVFPEQVSFEAPESVRLFAYLTVNGELVPANRITGVVTTESLQPLAELAYGDDGRDGDPRPGDHVYTALFEPDPSFAPELSESFLVRVVAETGEGEPRIAATGFLYSNPHAQLTGNYRDTIADGSLAIDAEVEVRRAGRFHLEGTLYSRDGSRGVGEAHTAAELPTGRHWMRLTFFGRLISQSEIDGPYLLRFLALSTTTAMPNAKNRLVENPHRTASYRFTQFNPAPFDDPDLLDAADRLERDLQ